MKLSDEQKDELKRIIDMIIRQCEEGVTHDEEYICNQIASVFPEKELDVVKLECFICDFNADRDFSDDAELAKAITTSKNIYKD